MDVKRVGRFSGEVQAHHGSDCVRLFGRHSDIFVAVMDRLMPEDLHDLRYLLDRMIAARAEYDRSAATRPFDHE
jgi:hypothetical protein